MTDSILRSYYNVSSSTFVPFAIPVEPGSALALLSGETDGFAIDATTYDTFTDEAYLGGPVGGTVGVIDTGTPANDLDDVPLDASNLTQSGTSPKMVHFPDSPYVRWSPHNMATYSQEMPTAYSPEDASWTANAETAPDGTLTADTLTANATAAAPHHVYYGPQVTTYIIGAVYTLSVYAKAGTNNYLALLAEDGSSNGINQVFDLSDGTLGEVFDTGTYDGLFISAAIVDAGGGWYRCILTYPALNTSQYHLFEIAQAKTGNTFLTGARIAWSGANGKTVHLWGAQVNRGYIPTPYIKAIISSRIGIPQSYDAAEAMYGIWVEPAATNVCLQSEDLATTWTNVGSTESTNTTTAPDGSTTADTITEDSGNSRHIVYQQTTLGSGTYTASVYVKRKDRQWASIATSDGDGSPSICVIVDLDTGTVTQTNSSGSAGTGSTVTNIGNGWYRVALTLVGATANPYLLIGLSNSATPSISSDAASYTGDGSSGIYYWGAQLEIGSVATSYIPTLGSTVTRARDNIQVALTTVPSFTSISGYMSEKLFTKGTTGQIGMIYHMAKNDGTGDNRIQTWSGSFISEAVGFESSSGGAQTAFPLSIATISLGTPFKTAFTAAANSFNGALNGVASTRDTSGAMPVGMTAINLMQEPHDATVTGVGLIYYMVVLPRAMLDAELVSKST